MLNETILYLYLFAGKNSVDITYSILLHNLLVM